MKVEPLYAGFPALDRENMNFNGAPRGHVLGTVSERAEYKDGGMMGSGSGNQAVVVAVVRAFAIGCCRGRACWTHAKSPKT